MNPYIGMEEYMNWETCGIQKGNILSLKEFEKLGEADKLKSREFLSNGETVYFYPKDTARNYIIKHLGCGVPANELFTEKVWTREVLEEINEKCIKPRFSYGSEVAEDDIDAFFAENIGTDE